MTSRKRRCVYLSERDTDAVLDKLVRDEELTPFDAEVLRDFAEFLRGEATRKLPPPP